MGLVQSSECGFWAGLLAIGYCYWVSILHDHRGVRGFVVVVSRARGAGLVVVLCSCACVGCPLNPRLRCVSLHNTGSSTIDDV